MPQEGMMLQSPWQWNHLRLTMGDELKNRSGQAGPKEVNVSELKEKIQHSIFMGAMRLGRSRKNRYTTILTKQK